MTLTELETGMNSFDRATRMDALRKAAAGMAGRETSNVNMHLHSFFSYNAAGWSPSRIAWEARKAGLYAAGLCDFDVLDGCDEFLQAGLMLGLRASVNVETRAILGEYSSVDINSPGEPGVTYVMGAGFARAPAAGTPQAEGLAGYRARARARNIALLQRINPHLPDLAIDYEKDVLPLTPTGSATERHIVSAYVNIAKSAKGGRPATVAILSKIIGKDAAATEALLNDLPALEEAVRNKLVKRGGVGYEQPSMDTFPRVEEFIRWVASCGAIPMTTWLDGTSGGEADGHAMLECMLAKGAVALNIIPDRNWNIPDPKTRAVKVAHLGAIVRAAEDLGLPVNIGTEMNKQGLPFVDDLDGEALRPHKEVFVRGARIMVGHSLLLRYADFSYVGPAAASEFGDVRKKNAFFEKVGALSPLTADGAARLEDLGPEKALGWFRGACRS